jgi:hypothetical protein
VNYWALVHTSGLVEAIEAEEVYIPPGSYGWVQFFTGEVVVLNLSPGFDGYFTPLTEEEYLLGKQEAEDEADR